MNDLIKKIKKYDKSKVYPFHMPGHKRRMKRKGLKNPYRIDLTEVDGFDDLHHPDGIILEAEQRAARIYQAERTYFSVNGSTAGILSAIFSTTTTGGEILVARNSHKAAYHAIMLRQLRTRYVYPQKMPTYQLNGAINAEDIKRELELYPDIQAVYITSPTAEGVVSDIESIAKICHAAGKPLIVDEAHGAHFTFSNIFPTSSIACGADLVIHSVHKTLPAFTQTALIHLNGKLANRQKLEEYLAIFQSSSPSYILMGGIDRCMEYLSKKHEKLIRKYNQRLVYFEKKTKDLQCIHIIRRDEILQTGFDYDSGKLNIYLQHTERSGAWLKTELRAKYKLEMEMATSNHVLAMTSIMDSKKGFRRLQRALNKIDKMLLQEIQNTGSNSEPAKNDLETVFFHSNAELTIHQAKESKLEQTFFSNAAGRISGEFVMLYPPGIPLIVPGELIEQEMIDQILEYEKQGLKIQGMHDHKNQWIETIIL